MLVIIPCANEVNLAVRQARFVGTLHSTWIDWFGVKAWSDESISSDHLKATIADKGLLLISNFDQLSGVEPVQDLISWNAVRPIPKPKPAE